MSRGPGPAGRRTARRSPSLRTQLTAAFVLVTVLTTALVSFSAVLLRRQAMVAEVTDRALTALQDDLLVAGARVNAEGQHTDGPPRRVLADDALGRLGDDLAAEDRLGGELLLEQPGADSYRSRVDVDVDDVPSGLRAIVQQGLVGEQRHERDGRTELVVGGRVASDALAIYRFVDLEGIDAELAGLWRTMARAGAIAVASALLIGLAASGRLLRPVRRARDAARRLGEGHLDTRLSVRGGDELADLSRSFNEMAASLQETVDELRTMEAQQRRFVADVSHELRTPLTALVAAVEVLEDELAGEGERLAAAVPEDRRRATLLAIEEVRGMRGLVEDLMEITRFDAGRAQLAARPTELADAVASTLHRRNLLDAVAVAVPPGVHVDVDPRRLDTIVANLVGNALTHGSEPVEVRAAVTGDDLVLEVSDAGPGVPDAVRERLFQRFAKGDQARTRSGGSGLGLAIAQENARLHGGAITLASSGPTGTTMRLTLPGRVLRTGPDDEVVVGAGRAPGGRAEP